MSELTCPFCNGKDFDAQGLKLHLTAGHCDEFAAVPAITRKASTRIGAPNSIARYVSDQKASGVEFAGRYGVFEYVGGEWITRAIQQNLEDARTYLGMRPVNPSRILFDIQDFKIIA